MAGFDGSVLCSFCSGCCFCRGCFRSFWWEGLAVTSVFQIWEEKPKPLRTRVFVIFSFMFHLDYFCCLVCYYVTMMKVWHFSLDSLTEALEAGDTGALLILLAIGIKAAFQGYMFG